MVVEASLDSKRISAEGYLDMDATVRAKSTVVAIQSEIK